MGLVVRRGTGSLLTCVKRCVGSKQSFLLHPQQPLLSSTLKAASSKSHVEGAVPRPDASSMGLRKKKSSEGTGKGRGPVGWVNLAVTGVILGTLYAAYRYAKARKEFEEAKERKREVGKAKIGGSFDLVDHTGKPRKSEDFYGKWVLLYFGFTHCPDICPDEMEKMALVTDKVNEAMKGAKTAEGGNEVVPLFITVDPDRDGVEEVAEYVKEFHPNMIGLTGSHEKILEACKAFRVYFSAGPRDDDDDYIVDHTIIIYLLDPEGGFVDYYGQTKMADEVSTAILLQIAKYQKLKKGSLLSFM